MNNQALQKRPTQKNSLSLVGSPGSPTLSLPELRELADVYIQSGAFPDLKNTAQAIVKIMAGSSLGFSPHVSIAGIHFFQGRAVIGANLLASLIKDSGKYEYKILQHDAKVCSIQMMQRYDDKWASMGVPVTYTFAEATAAGLTSKDVWKKFPADMLFAAVIRQACRRYCADVLRGTPTLDHYGEEESEIDATAEELPKVDQDDTIIDGEIEEETAEEIQPAPEAAGRDRTEFLAEVKDLCQQLNKAGDSIKWSAVNLTQYINDLFSVEDGLDALGNDSFTTLVDDLKGRLAELNKAA
jgi:hypothetical protein